MCAFISTEGVKRRLIHSVVPFSRERKKEKKGGNLNFQP